MCKNKLRNYFKLSVLSIIVYLNVGTAIAMPTAYTIGADISVTNHTGVPLLPSASGAISVTHDKRNCSKASVSTQPGAVDQGTTGGTSQVSASGNTSCTGTVTETYYSPLDSNATCQFSVPFGLPANVTCQYGDKNLRSCEGSNTFSYSVSGTQSSYTRCNYTVTITRNVGQ